MGNHIFQRAFLLMIIAVLATYTVLEYVSTRDVLSQCLEVTSHSTIASTPSLTSAAVESTNLPLDLSLADLHPDQVTLGSIGNEDVGEQTVEEPARSPTISKVTMMYGPHAQDETMKLIIEGHKQHAKLHGHGIHILDRQLLHGLWSKHAWMLMIMLEEMQKPEELRTQWLSWFDTDIIVMNPNVPLDVFLPPKDYAHINLLCTDDHNGLNNGAFMIRVGEWGVRYFVDSLALHTYQPDLKLKYSEQSAMEYTIGLAKYANKTMHVPQRWFNAYRGPRNNNGNLIRGQKVPPNTIMPGDLQLHFAGKKTTKALMPLWVALSTNETSGWNIPLSKTKLQAEIALFWKLEKEKQEWDSPVRSSEQSTRGKAENGQSEKVKDKSSPQSSKDDAAHPEQVKADVVRPKIKDDVVQPDIIEDGIEQVEQALSEEDVST